MLRTIINKLFHRRKGEYGISDLLGCVRRFESDFYDKVKDRGEFISYDMHSRQPDRYPRPTMRYAASVDGVSKKLFSLSYDQGKPFPVTLVRQLAADPDTWFPESVDVESPAEMNGVLAWFSRLRGYTELLSRAELRNVTPHERELVLRAVDRFCVRECDGECYYESPYTGNCFRKGYAYMALTSDVLKSLGNEWRTELKDFIQEFQYDGKRHTVKYLGFISGHTALEVFRKDIANAWNPGEREALLQHLHHIACQS